MPLLALLIDRVWFHGGNDAADDPLFDPKRLRRYPRWPIAAVAAALVYTLPTNGLFIAGIAIAESASLVFNRHRTSPFLKNIAALGIGGVLGVLLYLPVIGSMSSHGNALVDHFSRHHNPLLETFRVLGMSVLRSHLSGQWLPALTVVVALAATAGVFIKKPLLRPRITARRLWYLLIVAATPIMGFFVAGVSDPFWARLFSVGVPVYALLVCAACGVIYRLASVLTRFRAVLVVGWTVCAYSLFGVVQPLLDRHTLLDILHGRK